MQINQKGLDLITFFEGCKLRTYLDSAGYKTIGCGHRDDSLAMDATITQIQSDLLLKADLSNAERDVCYYVKASLTPNQFSSLVSFVFNLGSNAFEHSTLLRKLNLGDYEGAAKEFGRWNMAGGKILPGLVKRRQAEKDLFLTP